MLHVAGFRAADLDRVVAAINARGYGLTFGLHSRIDDRVERVTAGLRVGNAYVNRNQIGAIVGSQPFGGEGLSGTGPKAGGPLLPAAPAARDRPAARRRPPAVPAADSPQPSPRSTRPGDAPTASRRCARPALAGRGAARRAEAPLDLPGPTGESNRLSLHPRGRVLCLGAGPEAALAQAVLALAAGNAVLAVADGADALAARRPARRGARRPDRPRRR